MVLTYLSQGSIDGTVAKDVGQYKMPPKMISYQGCT